MEPIPCDRALIDATLSMWFPIELRGSHDQHVSHVGQYRACSSSLKFSTVIVRTTAAATFFFIIFFILFGLCWTIVIDAVL